MTTHPSRATEGPWRFDNQDVWTADWDHIAAVFGGAQRIENGHLIAAAPALRDALDKLDKFLWDEGYTISVPEIRAARAALKMAQP